MWPRGLIRRHMWVEDCCWFSPFLWEVFLRVLRFPPRQNRDIAIVSSFQVQDIAIIWRNQVRDIAIAWSYWARDITIIWRYQLRDIAIIWRFQERDIVIVWRTFLITSLESPRATKRNRNNKQTVHKKGQNSSTGPHKQTHKITLVLFIVLWGGSILLLSSCLMWIYFVFNTSRAESAFFSNFSLRQWQGNQKDLSFLINTTEQLSVFLFSDFS